MMPGSAAATISVAGRPGFSTSGDVEVALLVLLDFRLVDGGEAGGFQEAGDGLLGRADARALLLLAHVGRARGKAVAR